MFCQAASLTPSVLHEARKESPLRPLSWCSAANAVSAILADSSLVNFPDPHLKEEFPEQNLQLFDWWQELGLCHEPRHQGGG